MGKQSAVFFRSVPGFDTMLGSITKNAPAKTTTKRRRIETPQYEVNIPEHLKTAKEEETNDSGFTQFNHLNEELHSILNNPSNLDENGELDLISCVLDPQSFAQTGMFSIC